jgi:hypothetical protein
MAGEAEKRGFLSKAKFAIIREESGQPWCPRPEPGIKTCFGGRLGIGGILQKR